MNFEILQEGDTTIRLYRRDDGGYFCPICGFPDPSLRFPPYLQCADRKLMVNWAVGAECSSCGCTFGDDDERGYDTPLEQKWDELRRIWIGSIPDEELVTKQLANIGITHPC